jgi:hypothetical protein
VVIEFDAVNHDVLNVEGTVMPTPRISIPYDVFRMDCVGVAKRILLITFIEVPLVSGVTIVLAVTLSAVAPPAIAACPTKPAVPLMPAVEATS